MLYLPFIIIFIVFAFGLKTSEQRSMMVKPGIILMNKIARILMSILLFFFCVGMPLFWWAGIKVYKLYIK